MRFRHALVRALCATTIVVACAPGSASGQPMSRTTFGIMLGGTSSRVTGLSSSSGDLFGGAHVTNRFGVRAGVFVNRKLTSLLSVQPELYYIQKGTTLEATGTDGGKLDLSLAYVEAPLLLRADFWAADTWHPFVVAGPSFAFRVQCRGTLTSDGYTGSGTCKELNDDPTTDLFVKSDIGTTVGIGATGTVARRLLMAQVRYGRGLRTIVNNPSAGLSPKNSVFSFIVGFGIGR
jgi:hypothetical protein